jgi:hypothetical protein
LVEAAVCGLEVGLGEEQWCVRVVVSEVHNKVDETVPCMTITKVCQSVAFDAVVPRLLRSVLEGLVMGETVLCDDFTKFVDGVLGGDTNREDNQVVNLEGAGKWHREAETIGDIPCRELLEGMGTCGSRLVVSTVDSFIEVVKALLLSERGIVRINAVHECVPGASPKGVTVEDRFKDVDRFEFGTDLADGTTGCVQESVEVPARVVVEAEVGLCRREALVEVDLRSSDTGLVPTEGAPNRVEDGWCDAFGANVCAWCDRGCKSERIRT